MTWTLLVAFLLGVFVSFVFCVIEGEGDVYDDDRQCDACGVRVGTARRRRGVSVVEG